MRTIFSRRMVGLALVTSLGVALAWLMSGSESATNDAVFTVPVTRGDINVTVLAQGTLKPRNLVAVGTQASGRITQIAVEPGQTVEKGDLIAQIDAVSQTNDLRMAQSDLAVARAHKTEQEAMLELAERTLERLEKLQTNNLSARTEYDIAVSDVAVAEAQIDALDAQIVQTQIAIETAEANLGYTRITAPIDGTILAIVARQGQTVNAAQSAPTLVVLGDLTQMDVFAKISEADIDRVHPGQKVWFTVLGAPERRYETVLETVAPAPESIVNDASISGGTSSSTSETSEAIYYNGRFTVPNRDGRLRTYMTAEVHIVLDSARDVLTVPAMALTAPDADGYYRLEVQEPDGTLSERTVSVGLNDKVIVEIRNGLNEGDKIVIGGTGDITGSARRRRGSMLRSGGRQGG